MIDLRMLFPGGAFKALTISYDDGVEQDERLLAILNAHGLKCTFNLNSGLFAPEGKTWQPGEVQRRLSLEAAKKLYLPTEHEIAVHACMHGDLPNLPPAHALWQVVKDREVLETEFDRIIRGAVYPFGTLSDTLAETLQNCGMAYARTTVTTETFEVPSNWLKWDPTCRHRNPRLMELARQFVEARAFRPQLFYVWGHAYEFEMDDNWQVMEEFAAYVGGREDIWYATNIEVCDYVTAWRNMHISCDGSRIYNPSAIPLWIRVNRKTYRIDPGCHWQAE